MDRNAEQYWHTRLSFHVVETLPTLNSKINKLNKTQRLLPCSEVRDYLAPQRILFWLSTSQQCRLLGSLCIARVSEVSVINELKTPQNADVYCVWYGRHGRRGGKLQDTVKAYWLPWEAIGHHGSLQATVGTLKLPWESAGNRGNLEATVGVCRQS